MLLIRSLLKTVGYTIIITQMSEQDSRHLADDIFKHIFLSGMCVLIQILMKFVQQQ